jgi:hypothetical protein
MMVTKTPTLLSIVFLLFFVLLICDASTNDLIISGCLKQQIDKFIGDRGELN